MHESITGTVAADSPEGRGASSDPVFVLCAGRSGSTLLRFILDAHPDLACPPETNVPALCGQLANVWALIEGAPLSANRGDEPPEIPDAAIAGVRDTMDRMVGSYLARRGKKRYCDKSLGTARFGYLMTRVWPEAKFICLFRHPMDMIASGLEACPWGLNGYGFEPYIAETPGNTVFSLARFWVDNAMTILAAEQEYSEHCHRVRYEDMVTDTQAVADGLFEFLGVDKVPDIAKKIFAAERERFGPADYKIWHTSQISTNSLGRGWTIPAGLIGPQVREAINELCGNLGYLPVDDGWGTADQPADFRMLAGAAEPAADDETPQVVIPKVPHDPTVAPLLAEHLLRGIARVDEDFVRRWEPCSGESFLIVATQDDSRGPVARWRIDLGSRTVLADEETGQSPSQAAQDEEDAAGEEATGWDIIATAKTWDQILTGQTNVSVALRHHMLRYCDEGDSGPVIADTRTSMLADLLGLTSWGQAKQAVRGSRAQADEGQ